MSNKTWFIIIEKKEMIGNPIIVENAENEIVTDSNHNLLTTVGFFQDIKLAKNSAKQIQTDIFIPGRQEK